MATTSLATGAVVWHFTMSLDGFMADAAGTLDWLPRDAGPVPMGHALVPTIGAVLVGRGTWDGGIDSEQRRPYGGAFTGPVFVVTRSAVPATTDDVTFLTKGLPDAVRRAGRAAGGGTVVVLGAALGRACLTAGLLDEVPIHIAPVLIGAGKRAFADDPGAPVRSLRVLERSGADDMTSLRLAAR